MSAKKFFFKALLEISLKHPWGGVNECTRFPNRVLGGVIDKVWTLYKIQKEKCPRIPLLYLLTFTPENNKMSIQKTNTLNQQQKNAIENISKNLSKKKLGKGNGLRIY